MYTFYQYPSCSTCRKALKFLNEKEIEFKEFINKSEFARICLTSTFDIDINWLKGKPSL